MRHSATAVVSRHWACPLAAPLENQSPFSSALNNTLSAGIAAAAGGDGTQVYASCLTFYDRVPSDLCAKHEDLLGAVALKAMCLLSKRPYLTSSQQVRGSRQQCRIIV